MNKKTKRKKTKKVDITQDLPTLSTDDLNGTYEEIEKSEKVPEKERLKKEIDKAKKS